MESPPTEAPNAIGVG